MIHVAETVAVHSVEGFLGHDDLQMLAKTMSQLTARHGIEVFDASRSSTLHAVPGLSETEVMAVFEPHGRLEILDLPELAQGILDEATTRAMPAIRRVMPSISRCQPWVYIEYRPGQHITPHVDNIAPDPYVWPRQIAGIGVVVEPAESGGDFYVESTGDARLWTNQAAAEGSGYHRSMTFAKEGSDYSSEWFRTMPRTRWSVNPATGTALLYGSQLTHGTHPVIAGVCRKFISWLVADQPA